MKIAWFTPLSMRSAIGEFSAHVTRALAELAEVEIWTADEPPQLPTELPVFVIARDPSELDVAAGVRRDDLQHGRLPAVPWRRSCGCAGGIPGVVILHDRVLHHLFRRHVADAAPSPRRKPTSQRMGAYYGDDGAEVARDSLRASATRVGVGRGGAALSALRGGDRQRAWGRHALPAPGRGRARGVGRAGPRASPAVLRGDPRSRRWRATPRVARSAEPADGRAPQPEQAGASRRRDARSRSAVGSACALHDRGPRRRLQASYVGELRGAIVRAMERISTSRCSAGSRRSASTS